jgi:hypothetical protein
MFDEPQEDPAERAFDPRARAQEKADEFRMHADMFAVFEGCRKFDARILPGLDMQIARRVQQAMGKFAKAKSAGSPVLPPESMTDAAAILDLPATTGLSTNDYHINRRPGEVMIVRWLTGDQVEQFYERLQAHFNAAMDGFREDEKTENQWKQDEQTAEYLKALDEIDVKMADRYLREVIRQGISAAELVGAASAPPEQPSEQELAWYYKLFSLRGMVEGRERMCFFTFLQKTDEGFDF